MEIKINIAAILKDKPQGTKLYDWLHNIDVEFDNVETTEIETSIWCTRDKGGYNELFGYSKLGTLRGWLDGLQILLPSKKMRDWRKFAWKKGDVLVSNDGDSHIIFKGFSKNDYTTFEGKHWISVSKKRHISCLEMRNVQDYHIEDNKDSSQTYINTLEKRLGGKLNLETLEIEKQLEFKDWDFITIKLPRGSSLICVFKAENDENYYLHASLDSRGMITINENSYCSKSGCIVRLSTEEEKTAFFDALARKGKIWDVEKKKNIALKKKWTPKPFDRVITRNADDDIWTANIFSHMDSHGEYVTIGCVGGYTYCIPYNEETAKLIGTTNNVEG